MGLEAIRDAPAEGMTMGSVCIYYTLTHYSVHEINSIVLGIVVRTVCVLPHLFCTATQVGQSLAHITDEETEAQRTQGRYPGSTARKSPPLHRLIVPTYDLVLKFIILILEVKSPWPREAVMQPGGAVPSIPPAFCSPTPRAISRK